MTKPSIIVTGASRGIGRAIVERLLEKEYHVIGIARSFSFELPHFTPLLFDLSKLDKIPAFCKELQESYPHVEAIVSNVGQGVFGNLEELSFEEITEVTNLNFLSHVFFTKAWLAWMKRKGKGSFIFMGSEAALSGKRKGSLYCATKSALRGFTQALREECASSAISVTLVNPGMVRSSFYDSLFFEPGEGRDEAIEPRDVAELVVNLLELRQGTNIDEINLSPQKKVVRMKKKSCN